MWSKMRTAAWEIAFQIALRNCSKEIVGTVSIYVILVKGEYMQSSTYFFFRFLPVILDVRRYKNWAHKIGF